MTQTKPQTVTIEIGQSYPFYSEMQQEYLPATERLRRFTGTMVEVLRVDTDRDPEAGLGYIVKTWDGTEIGVNVEEIDGWDYALDQFFWNDGTYGKGHRPDFLSNERSN